MSSGTKYKKPLKSKKPISNLTSLDLSSVQAFVSTYKTADQVQQMVLKSPSFSEILKQSDKRKNFELVGKKHERVTVLGSFDTWNEIDTTAAFVSKSGYYATTSLGIYEKGTGRKISFSRYDHESMNDFLRRMIFGCQYAIVTYTVPSGQMIETAWCSESQKPTLGVVFTRPLNKSSKCKYAIYDSDCVFCNGREAVLKGEKLVGGWICTKDETCPFVKQNISKMVLDFYNTNPRMFLIGSDSFSNLKESIKAFLGGKGTMRLPRK
jgi:hypothetical protein